MLHGLGSWSKRSYTTDKSYTYEWTVEKYFDVNKDALIQTDSSKVRLRVGLLQLNHLVAYPWRAVDDAEQISLNGHVAARYSIWLRKVANYTYGRDIGIQKDHQALVSKMKRPLWRASPKLAKASDRLQHHQVEEISAWKVFAFGEHLSCLLTNSWTLDCWGWCCCDSLLLNWKDSKVNPAWGLFT